MVHALLMEAQARTACKAKLCQGVLKAQVGFQVMLQTKELFNTADMHALIQVGLLVYCPCISNSQPEHAHLNGSSISALRHPG